MSNKGIWWYRNPTEKLQEEINFAEDTSKRGNYQWGWLITYNHHHAKQLNMVILRDTAEKLHEERTIAEVLLKLGNNKGSKEAQHKMKGKLK